nr:complement factor H-related protein 5-like isoform X2 [Anolis sagrei ordinatus]
MPQQSWRRGLVWGWRWLCFVALAAFPPGVGSCTVADLPRFAYSEPKRGLGPGPFIDGFFVTYTCKLGFVKIPGKRRYTVCRNNTWSPIEESCTASKCDDPIVEHGTKISGFKQLYSDGDNVTFECNIGYFMIGSYFIQCDNNTWYPTLPSCKTIVKDFCGAPILPYGMVEPVRLQYHIGSIIAVYCKPNYSFPDETIEMSLTCDGFNIWEPNVQPCFLRTSPDTSKFFLHNGKIIHGKKKIYEPGDNITVECQPGYALNGPREIRYVGGGKWLPVHPRCYLNAFFTLLISGMYAYKLRPFLGKSDLAMVVHTLVTSRIDYCNALYVGLPLQTSWKLQLVQQSAARLLTGAVYRERTTPLLRQLHWVPISFRAHFKVLALTFKALNGSGPDYLSERISCYEPSRSLRSSGEALLLISLPSQTQLMGMRDRAFSAVAPCGTPSLRTSGWPPPSCP